jgi:SAM-dependent MidA family methyltransferase
MTDGPALPRIRERLRHEGRLTFAAFMAEALHGPEGYYTRRPRLGGADADFFTAPELHPAFGALLGELAARVWFALGRPDRFDLVEHGPGTGALCRDLLDWARHAAQDFGQSVQYHLVETSQPLRGCQRATLEEAGLLDGRVTWDAPPAGRSLHGLVIANELVDALPVHLVTVRDGRLLERYVVVEDDELGWLDDAASTPALGEYFERLGIYPAEGCLAEVNLEGVAWIERTAATLARGALLLLDYGYPASELYSPERRHGTLLTYRAHTLGSDPLRLVGAQDITAHVDFTSLARAGERGGLETAGLISQAALLRRLGLDQYLQQLDRSSVAAREHDANRRALQALVEPTGLGRVQALLQTRGLSHFDPFAAPSPGERVHLPDRASAAMPGALWLPLLRPGQMRLPGPLEAEGFLDLDKLWRELLDGPDQ